MRHDAHAPTGDVGAGPADAARERPGKAVGCLLGLWTGLTRFLDDLRIPLDNNRTERRLWGVVLALADYAAVTLPYTLRA